MIFFLDESGQDLHDAPYEVRAAVAVPNEILWPLLQQMKEIERRHFGLALTEVAGESKGKKLLSNKRFRHARQCGLLGEEYRRNLVRAFLQRGAIAKQKKEAFSPQSQELAAYAQAGHAYVKEVLNVACTLQCKAFAAIVDKKAQRPANQVFLRKDYRYLLDRFSQHTKSISEGETGLMVFDQTETTDSRRLLQQMESYANETRTGYQMTPHLVPAPFFVDSRLTPVIQLADLVAYIVNWGVRFGKVIAHQREELKEFTRIVRELEWVGKKPDELGVRNWTTYGFFHVSTLLDKNDTPHGVKNKEAKSKGTDTQSVPHKDQQKPHKGGLKSASEQSLLPLDLSTFPDERNSKASKKIPEKPESMHSQLFGDSNDDS